MSLFNKPKRNIRRRSFNEETDDNENRMEIDQVQLNKVKKKKDKPKQTLLSFGEELDEADDGEVFKVKKSSRSKKLMKQLDHERKIKKKGEEKLQVDSEAHVSIKCDNDLEIKTDDLVVKIKNTGPLILNGRAAVVAGKDDYDSDEEENSSSHTFKRKTSKPDSMRFLLESGCIPDAAMIHAARKKRQKARELGHDFIPVEEPKEEKTTKSRLVREEDHDRSDDDNSQDRLDMTVNTEARDKEKRREAFLASQIPVKLSDDESEHGNEEEEWEAQQIRKGVTGAQIAAAQQDSMMQQHYYHGHMIGGQMDMNMMPIPPPPPSIQPPPDPTKVVAISPQEIIDKMHERVENLNQVRLRHEQDQIQLQQELEQSRKESHDAEIRAPELAQRFRYYQELRGYVTDLVECLDEKLPEIIDLEERWLKLYGERANELMERRRQDTRDQAEEVTAALRAQPTRRGPDDEARIRRATEREGRRARRRRAREAPSLNMSKHIDGMSSDDEVTEQQNLAFKQQKEEIEDKCKNIFSDVMDDFSSVKGILLKCESWRKTDIEAYTEAYVPLCIPKIISPIIRQQLIIWNPLMESVPDHLECTNWYNSLLLYALDRKETEDTLKLDPDVRLIPLTIEKVLIPKLTLIVEKIWDPMSTSQTLRLGGTIRRLIRDYPNLNDMSKQLQQLFNAILDKIKSAVENDVFIPLLTKQSLDKNTFLQRQFTMAVKLLRNLLSWQGLLGDYQLKNLALGSLLNRYLLAGLRVFSPVDALYKANIIMSTLPRAWLQGETIEHLKMFALHIQKLSDQLDQADPAHNEAWEYSKSILKLIKPTT